MPKKSPPADPTRDNRRRGISRYLPRGQLAREHERLVRYLSPRIRRRVELKNQEDYVDLAMRLKKGTLELAAPSSCGYVWAKRRITGFVEVKEADYDSVRKIEKYMDSPSHKPAPGIL
jgi:hypothetical protein